MNSNEKVNYGLFCIHAPALILFIVGWRSGLPLYLIGVSICIGWSGALGLIVLWEKIKR